MSDETTTEQLVEIEVQAEPVQVREGRWRTRNGLFKDVTAMPTDHEDFAAAYPWWDGVSTWRNDGRWLAGGSTMDLVEYLGPIEPDKTQELETKTQELPEYTPPEGWQEVPLGEPLKGGDEYHAGLDRYIRRIEPQPQPQPQPQAKPVQVRDGRWRTRGGEIRNVTPTPEGDGRENRFPWWDAQYRQTWTLDGRYHFGGASALDLVEYLRPIEEQPQPEAQPEPEKIEELRSEVAYVQNLLGESQRRVTQLEELVVSLRTINDAQEKSFNAANKANDDLQHRLNVVAAEWSEQAETVRKLQIELDAAQQVPQAIADRFEEGWNQGTARAVETIVEWLEPIRHLIDAADNMAETEQVSNLAADIIRALPAIMRSLTGLTPED